MKFKYLVQLIIGSPKKRFLLKYCIGLERVADIGVANGSLDVARNSGFRGYYHGVDICKEPVEFQADPNAQYWMLEASDFLNGLKQLPAHYDAIICSHTIEHCYQPYEVFSTLLDLLKPGGYLFLSTPSAQSVNFPSRRGTLNFFDDSTHREPVAPDKLIEIAASKNCSVLKVWRRYRPLVGFILGTLFEPFGRIFKVCGPGGLTWYAFGFETVIILRAN